MALLDPAAFGQWSKQVYVVMGCWMKCYIERINTNFLLLTAHTQKSAWI